MELVLGSLPAGHSSTGWLEKPRDLGKLFCPTVEVLESGVSCCVAVHSPLKSP